VKCLVSLPELTPAGDINGAFHGLAKTFRPDVDTGDALAEDVMRPRGL
jgi:hypothetical protein